MSRIDLCAYLTASLTLCGPSTKKRPSTRDFARLIAQIRLTRSLCALSINSFNGIISLYFTYSYNTRKCCNTKLLNETTHDVPTNFEWYILQVLVGMWCAKQKLENAHANNLEAGLKYQHTDPLLNRALQQHAP